MTTAVLFDLDGTFADTAPDLGRAINTMRATRGLPPVSLADTRRVTSLGARGLLGIGFSVGPEHADYPALRDEFLRIYENNLCCDTVLFPGMAELIAGLEQRKITWGIVTNKAERFAIPLLQQLGYATRAACIIGGDTTGHMKPHPAPLLAAHAGLEADGNAAVSAAVKQQKSSASPFTAGGPRPPTIEYSPSFPLRMR